MYIRTHVCIYTCKTLGSPSTWNNYSAGQKHYLTFCAKAQRKELPTSESTLMLFVSHLADTGLTHSTIKVYLSSVRHLHVTQGQHSQFSKQLTPRLQQVLKGIKNVQAATTHPRVRRPITLEIMQGIKSVLLGQSHSYQNTMIWAACCLFLTSLDLSSNHFLLESLYVAVLTEKLIVQHANLYILQLIYN